MIDPPRQVLPEEDTAGILTLIQRAFAYMEDLINPPSSMHALSVQAIKAQAETGEVWVIEAQGEVIACAFLTPKPHALYVGKLAVDHRFRGKGLARTLMNKAADRAQCLGLPRLELQTRIELVENHRTFARLGFRQTGTSSHPGFDQPTTITMQRAL